MSTSSPVDARYYEVEVVMGVTAASKTEAEEALKRSGITVGSLVGEVLIDNVIVYRHEDE